MTIQKMITTRMAEAIKSRNPVDRDAYRFIKGKLDLVNEQPVPDPVAIKLIKGLLSDALANSHSFSQREVEILTELVPADLTQEETISFLSAAPDLVAKIKQCGREGPALGLAMKAFSLANKPVTSDRVKKAVAFIRSDMTE